MTPDRQVEPENPVVSCNPFRIHQTANPGSTFSRPSLFSAFPAWGWCRSLSGVLMVLFIFALMFLNGYGQIRMLGIAMCISLVIKMGRQPFLSLKQLRPVPIEIALYSCWVIWAGLSGTLIAKDTARFASGLKVVVQMLVMVWAIYGILRLHREALIGIFLAIITGGLIQIFAVLFGAEVHVNGLDEDVQRTGLTGDPNGLGYLMNMTLLAAFFLWGLPGRFQSWLKIAIMGLIPLTTYVLVASGSRKAFLGFGLVLVLWSLFASTNRRTVSGLILRFSLVLAILAAAYFVVPVIMENTLLGKRFQELTQTADGTVQSAMENNNRFYMYIDGFNMFLDHPLYGVGLENYATYSVYGCYSHSDYIEPLATTGLIGFLLYQSFPLILLFKAFKLQFYFQE